MHIGDGASPKKYRVALSKSWLWLVMWLGLAL